MVVVKDLYPLVVHLGCIEKGRKIDGDVDHVFFSVPVPWLVLEELLEGGRIVVMLVSQNRMRNQMRFQCSLS